MVLQRALFVCGFQLRLCRIWRDLSWSVMPFNISWIKYTYAEDVVKLLLLDHLCDRRLEEGWRLVGVLVLKGAGYIERLVKRGGLRALRFLKSVSRVLSKLRVKAGLSGEAAG
jgi:hypothetical protein